VTERILVAGEAVVDLVAERPGPLHAVDSFGKRAGGAPANVAVALARLGRTPAFRTRLATDPFGDFLADRLAEEGVSDRYVERDDDARTTLAFVSRDPDAERSFSFHRERPADARMEPGVVPGDAFADHEWLVVGGIALAAEPSRSTLLGLIDRARGADRPVVFDPNLRPELWPAGELGPTLRTALDRSSVVCASPGELRAVGVAGETPAALAADLLDRGPHTVFLTRGAGGAYARAGPSAPWGPARVDHSGFDAETVDATGAGDAFTAGVVAALSDGEPLSEAVAFANAVAALATTATGAMRALPDRAAVRAFRRDA
jgi:fructokinase